MQTQILIDSVVQQTTVFIAQLATAGGVRAPLAHVASQVFLNLTEELQNQGVRKKVIADMFGMALRTYHRRVRELARSQTDEGHTLWEAVLGFLRDEEPVSVAKVQQRFQRDDPEVVTGILNDLVSSGLAYRAGRGSESIYRLADEADFEAAHGPRRDAACAHLVWLAVYRNGPVARNRVSELCRLTESVCERALKRLTEDGQIRAIHQGPTVTYEADRFEVPLGTERGWEAAVLDHFQAMVAAITTKLAAGASRSGKQDTTGGSTWSLDVYPGHPFEAEALGTLARVRETIEELRQRIDAHNAHAPAPRSGAQRVVFYMGQYVRPEDSEPEDVIEET